MHHGSLSCCTKMLPLAVLQSQPELPVWLACPTHRALLWYQTWVVCSIRSWPGLQTELCSHTWWVWFCLGFSWLLVKDGEGSWLLTQETGAGGYLSHSSRCNAEGMISSAS